MILPKGFETYSSQAESIDYALKLKPNHMIVIYYI